MSIPAFDFQVHNSLFLVAHFHNMIIGGVIFGAFAGLTYWWPKFAGYYLNERIGRYAFWCWLSGFVLAFLPLYILGFMGATRRLDHYDPSMGWQGLFIVAGIGVLVIGAGIALQLLQIVVSYLQRKKNLVNGDPWNGRTLEWSTTTPPPHYNFAVIPTITHRDQYWEDKQSSTHPPKPIYQDIRMPKNSGAGIIIAGFAFIVGFAIIWHIWWLAGLGLLGVIISMIIRLSNDDTEYTITAKELAEHEAEARQRTASGVSV